MWEIWEWIGLALLIGFSVALRRARAELKSLKWQLDEERQYRQTTEELLQALYEAADIESWRKEAPKATEQIIRRVEIVLGIKP